MTIIYLIAIIIFLLFVSCEHGYVLIILLFSVYNRQPRLLGLRLSLIHFNKGFSYGDKCKGPLDS